MQKGKFFYRRNQNSGLCGVLKNRVAFPCLRSQQLVHLVCSLYTVDLIIYAVSVISITVKLSHKLACSCHGFFLVVMLCSPSLYSGVSSFLVHDLYIVLGPTVHSFPTTVTPNSVRMEVPVLAHSFKVQSTGRQGMAGPWGSCHDALQSGSRVTHVTLLLCCLLYLLQVPCLGAAPVGCRCSHPCWVYH